MIHQILLIYVVVLQIIKALRTGNQTYVYQKNSVLINQGFDENSPIEYQVPPDHLKQISEYSISFWFRFSYVQPRRVLIKDLHEKWSGILGVSEFSNYCVSNVPGYRALTLWLGEMYGGINQQAIIQFATYDLNANNSNNYKDIKINKDILDSSWIQIYFGFSSKKQKAFGYIEVYKQKESYQLEWLNITHIIPPQTLSFKLGGCNKNHQSLNGQYQGINFQYYEGSFTDSLEEIQQLLSQYENLDFSSSMITKKDNITLPLISKKGDNFKVQEQATDTSVEAQSLLYEEFDEYSISGWAKFGKKEKSNQINIADYGQIFLFRVSINKPSFAGEKYLEGDSTLVCKMKNDSFIFTTYSLGIVTEESILSIDKQIKYNDLDKINQWHFIYFGYSYKEHKAVVFIKFQNREQSIFFDNVWHMKPNYFSLNLGRDLFEQNAYHGTLRSWNFIYGPGAYIDKNFSQLFVDKLSKRLLSDLNFEEAINLEKVIEVGINEASPLEVSIPQQDLQFMEDVSFAFWFRFSYIYPQAVMLPQMRSNQLNIAQVTETGYCDQSSLRNIKLGVHMRSLNLGNPAYKFSTYQTNKDQPNYYQYIEPLVTDFDSTWNYLYFGHSYETNELSSFMYFSRSKENILIKFESSEHSQIPEKLIFRLGKCDSSQIQFNGQFFDVKFRYKGVNYMDDKDMIQDYMDLKVIKPSIYLPLTSQEKETLISKSKTFQQSDTQPFLKVIDQYNGVEEYSISGWAQWKTLPTISDKQLLFRITQWPEKIQADKEKVADRTMACFVGKEFFSFITYSVFFQGGSPYSWAHNIEHNETISDWFWMYFGYNYEQQVAFSYVRYNNAEQSHKWSQVMQLISHHFYIYLGKDKYYPAFNGKLKDWNLYVGKGAYKEKNFDKMHLSPIISNVSNNSKNSEFTIDNQKFESYTGYYRSFFRENQILQYNIPNIKDMQAISTTFWFRFSFTDPQRIPLKILRHKRLAIAGFTENNNYCEHYINDEKQISESIALWLNSFSQQDGISLNLETYSYNVTSQTKNKISVNQSIPLDARNIDNAWNWVYIGYSYKTYQLFGAFYFANTNSLFNISLNDIFHNQPPSQMKFILGRCGQDRERQLNGQFYEIQVRYDNLAFINSYQSVSTYLENYITQPNDVIPKFSIIPLIQCQVEYNQNMLQERPYLFLKQFRGAPEYSI